MLVTVFRASCVLVVRLSFKLSEYRSISIESAVLYCPDGYYTGLLICYHVVVANPASLHGTAGELRQF